MEKLWRVSLVPMEIFIQENYTKSTKMTLFICATSIHSWENELARLILSGYFSGNPEAKYLVSVFV
jgi:hypothetical protein